MCLLQLEARDMPFSFLPILEKDLHKTLQCWNALHSWNVCVTVGHVV